MWVGAAEAETVARRRNLKTLPPEKRVPLILERLGMHPGMPTHARPLPAVDGLILGVLSQNTTDVNSDRAFTRLRARFATWEQVRDAPWEEVEEAIRVAGLSEVKATHIQQILSRITADRGGIELGFLRDMPTQEARDYLMSLPGIGLKTSAILLLFRFGKPAFPVDTHIYRVSKRLALIPEMATIARAHQIFDAMLKPEQMFPLHVGLIMHGRRVCIPRRPRCAECPLLDLCPQVGVDAVALQ
jgi:endonuclease-3